MIDLYEEGKCGQGYESDRCADCKWVLGKDLGLLACGKGMIDSKSKIVILGQQ